ncbi:unnamed protein product [Moneuplotes crassus]|uniref:Uncharacterized protein n=1 Tax=Euplotes crassus TaxID=5936 RepID=A0AAD2D1Y5_EUPCR|nr:unnamed protein product [Moneuplotes crassus]
MKTLITLAMAVTVTIAATTLAENGAYKFSITFLKNSANSSNTDVILGLTVGSTTAPLTGGYYASGACVNVGTTNYQLTSSAITLRGFGIEWQCHSTCTSLDAVYNSVNFYAGAHWGLTTSQVVSAQSSLSSILSPAGSNCNNPTTKTVYHYWYGLTPSQLTYDVYFPNQTETWYVRCFGKFNYAYSVSFGSEISDLATTLGNCKNLSLKSRGSMPALATLAVAMSLCTSFL